MFRLVAFFLFVDAEIFSTFSFFSLVLVHQYPFRLTNSTEPMSPFVSSTPKPIELPKIVSQRSETENRKRRNPPIGRNSFSFAVAQTTPSVATADAIKVVPLTIFDFNGSPDYYEQISMFLDPRALHLVCVPSIEFQQALPNTIEDLFNGKFDFSTSSVLSELTQILQFLCDNASKTRAILILPIATCIDLYDGRPTEDRSVFVFSLHHRR